MTTNTNTASPANDLAAYYPANAPDYTGWAGHGPNATRLHETAIAGDDLGDRMDLVDSFARLVTVALDEAGEPVDVEAIAAEILSRELGEVEA